MSAIYGSSYGLWYNQGQNYNNWDITTVIYDQGQFL
jgi:hypothetical protein